MVMAATDASLVATLSKRLSPHPEIRTGIESGKGHHDDHGDYHRRHRAPPERATRDWREGVEHSSMEPLFIVHDSFVYDLSVRYHVSRRKCPEHITGDPTVTPTKTAPTDPLALERQVCFALVVASRSVLSVYRPLLEPMGLTHPQYLVMLALWENSPLSVREIGDLLQLDSPTLSPLLKRLAASGLISRERSGDDERRLEVDLTAKGRELRKSAEKIPPAVVARLGMELSELTSLHGALTKVIAAARVATDA